MTIQELLDAMETFPINEEPTKFNIIQHTGLKNVQLLQDPVVKFHMRRMNDVYDLTRI